jgi:nucleotide-binding universal stress UspA family protein
MGTAVDHVLRNAAKPVLVVKNRVRSKYTAIVAGTDFSPASAHAIVNAARMFPNAVVHVVHGWHVPFQGLQQDTYVVEQTEAEDTKEMASFMAGLSARAPLRLSRLAGATSAMVRGSALDAVRDGLMLVPDALVVLGSHGTSGFRQAVIGSTISDLLRHVEADILVVNTKDAV